MNSQQPKSIFFSPFFVFILFVIPSFVFAQVPGQPPLTVDLQTQIQNLLKQIQALQQQVAALQAELGKEPEKTTPAGETRASVSPPESAMQEPEVIPPELTRPLSRGSSGDDVRKLQEFLAKDKDIYPDGLITGYFGPLTETAVKKWQEKHGIESIGIIGPKSIAKFKDLGRGRVKQLLEQGAGVSGNISPGLLIAPGVQKKVETTVPTSTAVTILAAATTTPITVTTTPSGTIPAVPATPAQPTSGTGTVTVPAVPATPAQSAATTTTATTTPVQDTASPSVPTNLTATAASSTQINLSWTASTDNVGVTGYRIYRGGGTQISAVTTSTSYSDTGLAVSTAYLYTVAAYDAAGNVSGQSNLVTATTLYSGTCAATIINGYSVPSKNSGESVTVATSSPVSNGTRSASTTFTCNSGVFTAGPETADITCNSGYTSIGIQCVQNASSAPTPTNVQAVTNSNAQAHPPVVRYYMTFNYTLQSTTQSFNIYRKRPNDSAFVKYTYSAQTPVNPSILPIPGSNESTLYHRSTNQWEWWTTLPAPAPDSAVGNYEFYVTAVDTNGVESTPSETKSFKLYAAPVISSPAEGSMVSSLPTITVSGDPNAPSPTYGMVIYKQTTGNTSWSAWPAPSTSFIYPGPALNPSDNPHRLVVWFSSGIYDRSFFGTSIFNISTTTSYLDLRANNLATISQTLNEIKEKLLRLLKGL